MKKNNEILTIAGKRVEKRYSTKAGDCCGKCCFWSDTRGMCDAERADSTPPCQDYDSKESGFAYFAHAEEKRRKIRVKNMGKIKAELQKNIDEAKEIEGISQKVTLIPSNEDAEKAAMKYYLSEGIKQCDGEGKIYPRAINEAFKAGIQWTRERLMKDAQVVEGIVCGRVADHINIKVEGGDYLTPRGVMHILADKSKYEIGEKVKIIILKEDEK